MRLQDGHENWKQRNAHYKLSPLLSPLTVHSSVPVKMETNTTIYVHLPLSVPASRCVDNMSVIFSELTCL